MIIFEFTLMGDKTAFDDLRVLDLSTRIPGEYATLLMADLGADIVKVERPDPGGPIRQRDEPAFQGDSRTHAVRNRGKCSVVLDLKTDGGREGFLSLAEEADVVFESFRPGVVDRLGIGYEDVREVNPNVVYGSLSGYGQTGPYAKWPGHDANYMGVGGLLSTTGRTDSEPPRLTGVPMSDMAGGLCAAFMLLAAVHRRNQSGRGGYVDVSMTEVVAQWIHLLFPDVVFGDDPPTREEWNINGSHAGYNVYETKDGEYLSISALEPHFWAAFCEEIDLKQYADDYDHIGTDRAEEIHSAVSTALDRRTREEWMERFRENDIPAAPIHSLDEFEEDPQLSDREFTQQLSYPDGSELRYHRSPTLLSGSVLTDDSPAPLLGEHSATLLHEVGYTDEEIAKLERRGVIEVRSR